MDVNPPHLLSLQTSKRCGLAIEDTTARWNEPQAMCAEKLVREAAAGAGYEVGYIENKEGTRFFEGRAEGAEELRPCFEAEGETCERERGGRRGAEKGDDVLD